MVKKIFKTSLQLARSLEILTSIAMYLTVYTGKSKKPTHPKHLTNDIPWFVKLISKNDKVLDLGCGTGYDSLICAKRGATLISLDISDTNIRNAKNMAKSEKITDVTFKVHDANKTLPFHSNYFDKVLMFDILEHLHRRDFALKEVKRVLKVNGLLLLVTDNPETKWKHMQKSAGLFYFADKDHKYEYPLTEITGLLSNRGFKVLSTDTVVLDTPLKPLIDFVGGFSLSLYKKITNWRIRTARKYPNESTGFQIVAKKISL